MTDGVNAVLGRISEIQSQLRQLAPPSRPTVLTTTRANSFAATLDSATRTLSGTVATPVASPVVAAGWQPSEPASTGRSGGSGADVIAAAKKYLGVPYVWGGTDPAAGLDCSGLVQRVYDDLGFDLPRVSRDQARAGRPVASLAEARPGDLVAFGSPVDHIGIYVGGGKMIAAPYPGERVRIEPVSATPTAIRRILPDAVSTATQVQPAAGRTPYAGLFAAATEKYDLPAGLLAAVAKAESAFDPDAVSPAGARGLMQLMPATARGLGVDPFAPAQAVDGAARLLRSHVEDYGSVPLALAAYNAGPGAVQRYGGIPPYAETQAYVTKVQKFQRELS